MKSVLAAAAVAAVAFGFANLANAAPASGGLDAIRAGADSSLVQHTGYYHRHRHCWWNHGHRHCVWR